MVVTSIARRLARSAARIAVAPAIVYGVLCAFLYSRQETLLFLPERAHVATPDKLGMEYDDVTFVSRDGTRLHGWFLPSKGPSRATVIHCHGNGGNVSYLGSTLGLLHDRGFATLAFDYRNYGESGEGPWSEQAIYEDADAAWIWLTKTRGVDPGSVVFWGQSMGGGVCSWLAREKGGKALVLESTFTTLPAAAAEIYWYVPVQLLSRYRFGTIDRLPAIEMPIAVAHAIDDDIIPIEHGRRNFDAIRGRKLFVELRGGHNDGFDLTPGAMDRVVELLALPGSGD